MVNLHGLLISEELIYPVHLTAEDGFKQPVYLHIWLWPLYQSVHPHMLSLTSLSDQSDQSDYPQRMDLNGDGVVTLDEFLDFCSSDPATLQSLSQLATTL